MYRIIFSAYRWGRAIRPPRYLCRKGKYPSHHSHEKIHIHERGHKRALCGFIPAYQWEELDKPNGISPICNRCFHTAMEHEWIVDEIPKKPLDKKRKTV